MGSALCSFLIGGKHRIRNETYLSISPADFQSVAAPWLLYFPYLTVYANAIPLSSEYYLTAGYILSAKAFNNILTISISNSVGSLLKVTTSRPLNSP